MIKGAIFMIICGIFSVKNLSATIIKIATATETIKVGKL